MDNCRSSAGLGHWLGDGYLGTDDGHAATDGALTRVWGVGRITRGHFRVLPSWSKAGRIQDGRGWIRGPSRLLNDDREPGCIRETAGTRARCTFDLQGPKYFQPLPARGYCRLFHWATLQPGNRGAFL